MEKAFVYCGEECQIDRAHEEEINIEKFEREHGVSIWGHYEIQDTYAEKHIGQYVYLGHGWSLCQCDPQMYILPSHYPHYYTGKSEDISPDCIAMAIQYIEIMCEEQMPYEIDA